MALTIDGGDETVAGIVSDRRLYLTGDKERVVEEGDPSAKYLLAGEGSQIPAPEADRLDLSVEDGRVVYPGAESETESTASDENHTEIRVEQNGSWYTGYRDGEQVFKVQGEDAMKAAVAELEG